MIEHSGLLCDLTPADIVPDLDLYRYFALCLFSELRMAVCPALARIRAATASGRYWPVSRWKENRRAASLERDGTSPLRIFSEHFQAPPGEPVRFLRKDVSVEQGGSAAGNR